MSRLRSFVYRSRADACDQLISSLRNPIPVDRTAPRPADPLDRPVRDHAAARALALLADDTTIPALRSIATDPRSNTHVRELVATELARRGELDRALHRELMAECASRCRARTNITRPFDSDAFALARMLVCRSGRDAFEAAIELLDTTRTDIRVSVLAYLAESTEAEETVGTALVDHFEERFWMCDRVELDAVARDDDPMHHSAHALVEGFAIAASHRSRRAREWLFEWWARAQGQDEAKRRIDAVRELPGFVEFVARDAARLERTARSFDLPGLVASEVLGRDRFVRLVQDAIRRAWVPAVAREWTEVDRAHAAADNLRDIRGAASIAATLLADFCAHPRESVREADGTGLVDALVQIVWDADRAGAVALARSAAMRTVGGASVRRAVLARIARDPKPEDRDEAWRAMRDGETSQERGDGLVILESLGEDGEAFVGAVRSLRVDDDAWLAALRARVLSKNGDRSFDDELVRIARGDSVRGAIVALDALAPRAREHMPLYAWVLTSDPRADCPCCSDLPLAALRGYGAIVDEDSYTVLFRALLRPEHDEVQRRIASILRTR